MNTSTQNRKLYILRHGERVDFCFPDLFVLSFDDTGSYTPLNLNMPDTLPRRSDGTQAWFTDSPLTKVGTYQAYLTGEAFQKAGLKIEHVYCSPSFRCVQTCDAFLKGCNKRDELAIRIELGLFELMQFCKVVPMWMQPQELAAAGFNVDLEYQSIYTSDTVGSVEESSNEFYARSAKVTQKIIESCPHENILFVGHSPTLMASPRELVGLKPKNIYNSVNVVKSIPYCAFLEVQEKDEKWEMTGRPISELDHSSNSSFDYNLLK